MQRDGQSLLETVFITGFDERWRATQPGTREAYSLLRAVTADLVVRLMLALVHRNARKGVGVQRCVCVVCLRNVLIPLTKGSCHGVPITRNVKRLLCLSSLVEGTGSR